VLAYAKKKGLILTLFSNGTLLNEENVQKLAACPPNSFEITLYGATQATYEKVTDVPRSFSRLMTGLDLLEKYKLPVTLKTILMKDNFHEFPQIRELANQKGVNFRFNGVLFKAIESSDHPVAQRISIDELVQTDSADADRVQEYKARAASSPDQYPTSGMIFNCGAGLRGFHIDSFGMLSPCLFYRVVSYNLRTGSFQEGWNNELNTVRHLKASADNRCLTCAVRHLCINCPGIAYLENHDIEKPVDYMCQMAHLRAKTYSTGKYGEDTNETTIV
jgi:radical SAM protein with 4Fe4S-binding SPASM domain